MPEKIFVSALSNDRHGMIAVQELADKVKREFNGASCDLAVLFISEGYDEMETQEMALRFRQLANPVTLIGCNTSGVIGDKKEIEMEPAVSVLAMHLPGVKITPFLFTPQDLEYIPSGQELIKHFDLYPTEKPQFICLADPITCDVSKLLNLFNEAYGESPVIGGLASGKVVGVENWLILDDEIVLSGAIGAALSGDIEFNTVVSQGCRPIGEPYIITKAEKNIISELAGRPVLKVLSEVFESLSAQDQQLAKHSLFVGLVMDEQRAQFSRGDFLIRNIMGIDYDNGLMGIGEMIQPGQTLQFQLRDARTAQEDLETLLKRSAGKETLKKEAALLVSCVGRGRDLFREPDHDIRLIQSLRGPMPVAGFFANGEFGPIDRKNYIHGYTSSLTILR